MAIGFPAITAGSLTITTDLNGHFELPTTVGWLYGAAISPDGTKLFALDRRAPGAPGSGTTKTGKVHQFTAPAGWYNTFNVEPTYDNVSLSWAAQAGNYTRGLRFNTSGNRLYILNETDSIYQYNLGTAWNLSGASYSNNSITLTTVASDVTSILFNNNGTKLYVLDKSSTTIYQYTMSTPDDISTATYDGSASDYTIPGSPSLVVDFSFNEDGTKLYVQQGAQLHRYSLSVAYDTSTATPDNTSDGLDGLYLGSNHPGGITFFTNSYVGFIFNHDRSHVLAINGQYNSTIGDYISGFGVGSFTEAEGVGDGSTFTFNNRDYIYDGTKEAWEVNSPITVAQSGSPVSDLSELTDSTSILNDPANEVLTYADLNAILAVTNPATGQLAFNLDTSDMYIFGGTNWQKVYDEDDVPPPVVWYGDRGVVGSLGWDYWSISTQGTAAQSTGQLQVDGVRIQNGCASDGTYGYVAGGYMNDSPQVTATIEYINFANTSSNAQDFGDMTTAKRFCTSCGDDTRGIIAGGTAGSTYYNETEYITYASPGNASAFGTLNTTNALMGAAVNDSTYALFQGDTSTANVQIDYVTIQTTGNASDFGDGSEGRYTSDGAGDATYALIAGGGPTPTDSIDYFTFVTPSNATDFGNLSNPRNRHSAAEDGTYATFARGTGNVPDQFNDVDYVTVQTPGNASSSVTLVTSASGNRHWSASGAAA
jgi:hypothetical protein